MRHPHVLGQVGKTVLANGTGKFFLQVHTLSVRVEVAPLIRDIAAEIALVADTASGLLGGPRGRDDGKRSGGEERWIVRGGYKIVHISTYLLSNAPNLTFLCLYDCIICRYPLRYNR